MTCLQSPFIKLMPFYPQTLNRYAYCYNNPIMIRDLDGHYGKGYWEPGGGFFTQVRRAFASIGRSIWRGISHAARSAHNFVKDHIVKPVKAAFGGRGGGSSGNNVYASNDNGTVTDAGSGNSIKTGMLPDNVINILSPYYSGFDLTKIRINDGIPWYVRWFGGNPDAYTSGNDIYFKPGMYDPNSARGISLIGHEVTHSVQYEKNGTWGFRSQYLSDYNSNRRAGMNQYNAYYNISFEVEARKIEKQIYNALSIK